MYLIDDFECGKYCKFCPLQKYGSITLFASGFIISIVLVYNYWSEFKRVLSNCVSCRCCSSDQNTAPVSSAFGGQNLSDTIAPIAVDEPDANVAQTQPAPSPIAMAYVQQLQQQAPTSPSPPTYKSTPSPTTPAPPAPQSLYQTVQPVGHGVAAMRRKTRDTITGKLHRTISLPEPPTKSPSPPKQQPVKDPYQLPKPNSPTPHMLPHESTGSVYFKQMMQGRKPVASISQYHIKRKKDKPRDENQKAKEANDRPRKHHKKRK